MTGARVRDTDALCRPFSFRLHFAEGRFRLGWVLREYSSEIGAKT